MHDREVRRTRARRRTIGGVVGNNATGAHSILYGMTSDNVRSVKVMLYDGSVVELGPITPAQMADRARHTDAHGALNSSNRCFSGCAGVIRVTVT